MKAVSDMKCASHLVPPEEGSRTLSGVKHRRVPRSFSSKQCESGSSHTLSHAKPPLEHQRCEPPPFSLDPNRHLGAGWAKSPSSAELVA